MPEWQSELLHQHWFIACFYLRCILACVLDNILSQFLFFMSIKCSALHESRVAHFAVQRYAMGGKVFLNGEI